MIAVRGIRLRRLRPDGRPHRRQPERERREQRQDEEGVAPGQSERAQRAAGVRHGEDQAGRDQEGDDDHADEDPATPVERPVLGARGGLVVLASRPLLERVRIVDVLVGHPDTRPSSVDRRPEPHIPRTTGRVGKNPAGFTRAGVVSTMRRTDGGDAEHASDEEHGHEGEHVPHDHDEDAVHPHDHGFESIGIGVVTVSTSRTLDDDPAGDAIAAAIEDTDHEVVTRELVADDHDGVQGSVDGLVGREDVDCVVTTGGTGVTPDDVTIEAVRPLFAKELPGFGELFRALSREEIGTRVVATRATAGIVDRSSSGSGTEDAGNGVPVFCLPGSEDAARLGVDTVIEEGPHLAGLAARDDQ